MARWLVIQLDGLERRVPKSVALLAVRRGEAVRPDPNKRIIFERTRVRSSDPSRLSARTCAAPIVVVDAMEVLKRTWQESHGLLVNYPIKDQRGKLGRTPKPGALAKLSNRKQYQGYNTSCEIENKGDVT